MKPNSEREQRESRLVEDTFQMPYTHNASMYVFTNEHIVSSYQLPRRNSITLTTKAVRQLGEHLSMEDRTNYRGAALESASLPHRC